MLARPRVRGEPAARLNSTPSIEPRLDGTP